MAATPTTFADDVRANRFEVILFAVIALLGLGLRFWDLNLKPLHSDEGVNAYFLIKLFERGFYEYNPANYHGPFLYYIGLIGFFGGFIKHLLGFEFLTEAVMRGVPALFGVACFALLPGLRREIRWPGLVVSATLFAISPPMVYFSRTAIHEIYVIFFSLTTVGAFVLYLRAAPEKRLRYLTASLLSAVLIYTNKETAIITYAAWGLALFGVGVQYGLRRSISLVRDRLGRGPLDAAAIVVCLALLVVTTALGLALVLGVQGVVAGPAVPKAWGLWTAVFGGAARVGASVVVVAACVIVWFATPRAATMLRVVLARQGVDRRAWLIATGLSVAALIVLFTSFFTNPNGLTDMFGTLITWIDRGAVKQATGHEKPFGYYFRVMMENDAPVLWILGTVVAVLAVVRRDRVTSAVLVALIADRVCHNYAGVSLQTILARGAHLSWFTADRVWFLGASVAAVSVARRSVLSQFFALWSIVIVFAYCSIPYKTPWLVLNLTAPMMLLAGSLVSELVEERPLSSAAARHFISVWLVASSFVLPVFPPRSIVQDVYAGAQWAPWFWETLDANFWHYDDDRYQMIYVQSSRDMRGLIDRTRALTIAYPKEPLDFVTADYWPMPFYLHTKTRLAAYHAGTIPKDLGRIVIARSTQEAELAERLVGYRIERFLLRPGVVLALMVDPQLWDPLFGHTTESSDTPEPNAEKHSAAAPAGAERGLRVVVRSGLRCDGEVIAETRMEIPEYPGKAGRRYAAPFCMEWEGWLDVPAAGQYEFSLTSDDGSWLSLGGAQVIDNGGAHGRQTRTTLLDLKAGSTPIRVRYFDAGGGAMMWLRWKVPSAIEWTEVPAEHFSSVKS